jgi:hypothetical protein
VGLTKYIKAAFLMPWNLLLFGGGMALAALSFDANLASVIGSLVMAGEVAYLGLLGTHPKFQQYLEAQKAKAERGDATVGAEQALQRMVAALPAAAVQRFEGLRSRCLELRQIAASLGEPGSESASLEQMQLAGLDRLLWIFLRLLFTENALGQFLQKTSEKELQHAIQTQEARLKALSAEGEDAQRQRMAKSLQDTLETSRARLENYHKAKDQIDLVKLEIERLENKIRSLSELAVNRQEPNFISEQVDQTASSMVQTERTMNDLRFVTGLSTAEEEVPRLVQRQSIRATQ